MTYLRNKITNFFQEPNETFNEAWERFKGLLRQCPHHGFSELHQLDTFYNSLNSNDQDALDSAAGGNFLDKMPQEGLAIIESKSKVRYSRSRANDSRVSTDAPLSTSSPSNNSFDMQQIAASLEDKMTIKMKQMMNEMKALVVTTPAPIKAVEEVCVTCGSNHNFNHCPLTRGGNDFPVFHDNIQQFQQTAAVGTKFHHIRLLCPKSKVFRKRILKTTSAPMLHVPLSREPNETFNEAWERFKGLLRQCPHHGFSELHQLDTFYNSLNSNDQDALDSAAGGNFLDKMPQEGLAIIESKSKVRYSRSRANDTRVSTDAPLSNSSPSNNSFDMQQIVALEDKMTIKMTQMSINKSL
ncbi:reverse transcriptase domain-containing protein [Tanacetum coccineum]